ncbi:MAG: hypothetical protein IT204_14680 [Fimbriimonadaceae bacterium]|nr:hypothetical protein [Fimbriimonadaceae bacterium]
MIHNKRWLLLPGSSVLCFALASIVLPVGSAGLGARVGDQPGLAPALARWARDLHDGFHRGRERPAGPVFTYRAASHEGAELAARGLARETVAWYRSHGLNHESDREVLYDLFEHLLVNGQYDLAEWYVREADMLLGGGVLRNNLAWHYTQTGRRAPQALGLALSSVNDDRNACNVDTLAWAYFRAGHRETAERYARQTLQFATRGLGDFGAWEEHEAQESSRRLLDELRIDAELAALQRER